MEQFFKDSALSDRPVVGTVDDSQKVGEPVSKRLLNRVGTEQVVFNLPEFSSFSCNYKIFVVQNKI